MNASVLIGASSSQSPPLRLQTPPHPLSETVVLERDGPTDHLLAQVKIAVRNATCQKATSAAAGMVRQ